jgi:tetrameric-type glycyl-tRNA synthetase alpha subunit
MWRWARAPWRPKHFCGSLGPDPYRVAYVQPSRRPADGRYGENPNRLYKHQQLQVILKPSPADVIDLYLGSLQAIGIDLRKHDIKFEEDNWEAPTLGAWGIGWQVMLDGLEISQFTYFQQCGGFDLDLIPAELTYGLERIVAFCRMSTAFTTSSGRRGFCTATCASKMSSSFRSTTSSWPTSACCGSSSICMRRNASG